MSKDDSNVDDDGTPGDGTCDSAADDGSIVDGDDDNIGVEIGVSDGSNVAIVDIGVLEVYAVK